MPWNADDEEINGIVDSNLKDSPPNPPAVNTAATMRAMLKSFWGAVSGQVKVAVDYGDDQVSIALAAVDNQLTETQTNINEQLSITLADVETRAAAAEAHADSVVETFSLADSIGDYDASTGIAKLTASEATSTPGVIPAFANGKYLDVIKDGTQSITGTAVNMVTGGRILVRGTKWAYLPKSDSALQKAISNESLIYQKFDQVFSPATLVNGFLISAKGRSFSGTKLIQPDFLFNAAGITWGGSAVDFVFSCKIVVKTNNISSIANLLTIISANSAAGVIGTTPVQYLVGGSANPVYNVPFDYIITRSVNTAKQNSIHNFINFDPIDDNLQTDILIYEPTLTIGGVSVPFVGCDVYRTVSQVTDTVTVQATLTPKVASTAYADAKKSEAVADANGYTSGQLSNILNFAPVSGYRYLAKSNNLNLVQPIFAFNVSALTYGIGSTGIFTCKILTRSGNIVNIPQIRFFFNGISVVDDTSGSAGAATGAETLQAGVIKNYSKTLAISFEKQNYAHIYIDFDLVNDTLATEIYIYDVALQIEGNAATRIAGTALYRTVSGDTIDTNPIPNVIAPVSYVDQKFAAANNYTDSKMPASPISNQLSGKKYGILADSIAAGANGVGYDNSYHRLVAIRNGMTSFNYAIAGTKLSGAANGFGLSMSDPARYGAMDSSLEYILVAGLTNDISASIPIGTDSDNTVDTVKGALNLLCIGLMEKYPNKKIGFITPFRHRVANDDQAYADAMITICGKYSIPVLDWYRTSGVYPLNTVKRTAQMQTVNDYQHPNAATHLQLSHSFEAFLRRL